ncbi:MAG: chemotaxis protein CheC [Firmicutes bacterium]|nr:chemotaxis protein CheC [Bacillota bacterium]
MRQKRELSPTQIDLLRELSNIGAGNAATALSTLLGDQRLEMTVPEVLVCSLAESMELIGGAESVVVGIYVLMSGDSNGRVAFIFPEKSALKMLEFLVPGKELTLDSVEVSALQEVGNIVVSSYLNALAKSTGLTLIPSVPALAVDVAGAIWSTILAEAGVVDDVPVIKTTFQLGERAFDGVLMMIPEPDYFEGIFSALLDQETST